MDDAARSGIRVITLRARSLRTRWLRASTLQASTLQASTLQASTLLAGALRAASRTGLLAAALVCLPIAPSLASELAVTEVAPGVYVHEGRIDERSTANLGDQANIGFIVGARCVAVIDTGGSRQVGNQLRAAIQRVTQLPVCYVINTHVHPDHLFGNAAFVADKPEFIAHERLAGAMNARGRNYLNSLTRDLGDAAAGSELVPPTRTVAERTEIDLGGRVLQLRAWPKAHTDHDLTVRDEQSGTLWLSDLLFLTHVPALDGSIKGWLAVLQELKSIGARHVIPGHGALTARWPDAAVDQERYLGKVLAGVRAAIKDGKTITEAIESIGWDEKDRWREFVNFHRRNVTTAYAELEWE